MKTLYKKDEGPSAVLATCLEILLQRLNKYSEAI